MEKSEELQIATSGKNMDIHRMEGAIACGMLIGLQRDYKRNGRID